MSRGVFITFEGIEGAGKSTQIDVFADELRGAGIDVVQTREPGGTPNAERIRKVLKGHSEEAMPPVAELLLMFAARAINTENTIRPAIEAGSWVVADRYTDSTRAYQGGGRGQPMERINTVAEWVHGHMNPTITVLLDIPASVGLARAGRRGQADRFEREALEFFERVREAYLDLARREPDRIVLIDASGELESVSESVRQLARKLIIDFKK